MHIFSDALSLINRVLIFIRSQLCCPHLHPILILCVYFWIRNSILYINKKLQNFTSIKFSFPFQLLVLLFSCSIRHCLLFENSNNDFHCITHSIFCFTVEQSCYWSKTSRSYWRSRIWFFFTGK